MTTVSVGPYEVRSLSVAEGLALLDYLGDETKQGEFRTKLILASVTKDGEPIADTEFGSLMPHMTEILTQTMAINGFSGPK